MSVTDVSPPGAGLNPAFLNELDLATERFIDSGEIPGAVILVARRGKIGHLAAYGNMGIGRPDPMRTDAVFRIFSMTKPITTAVALMFYERGAFDLDDSVARWLPDLRHLRLLDGSLTKRDITVRDLMCHTAGFSNVFGNDPLAVQYRKERVGEGNLDALVKVLGRLPLLHQPGDQFHYSMATDVLGKLIEVWAGSSLDQIFNECLFEPLGMNDTAFAVGDEIVDSGRFPSNHLRRFDGTLTVADPGDRYQAAPERLAGASGLLSTTIDYFKFSRMLLDGGTVGERRVLGQHLVSMMMSNLLPDSALPVGVLGPLPGLGFGLGLSVRVNEHAESDPGAQVKECGWGGAAGTHFWIQPKEQLIVITMRQTMPYDTRFENVIKPIVYRALR